MTRLAFALPLLPRDWEPVDIPRDDARDAARDELSRVEYHRDDPNPVRRILDWLFDRLGDLVSRAGDNTPGGYTGLAVIVLLLVAALVLLRLRLGPLGAARRAESPLYGEQGPMPAARHRAAADAHAAAGRWDEAVRERFRAIVRDLEERAVLDVRPGRTADEAAVEGGRGLPEVAADLRAAAAIFDDVHYGGRTADRALDDRLRDLDARCAAARPRAAERIPG
ncbi:DUF4129 domain-containing protein [Embleya hyalina]|uniref:Protein-glutamine gamma-glutamyltransferase-like C-terminal domain-containing protein n=1 Tax=Embleya hyalina TaxID=516124 RepID=A0A401Z586_9ACTN|nr:DUF4129 domain-containing protein [Embleya hyalina]GCE02020.1 hypothetical protein EHYA_09795 [Embleya hyalina]